MKQKITEKLPRNVFVRLLMNAFSFPFMLLAIEFEKKKNIFPIAV